MCPCQLSSRLAAPLLLAWVGAGCCLNGPAPERGDPRKSAFSSAVVAPRLDERNNLLHETREVTGEELRRLASFFPGVGEGRPAAVMDSLWEPTVEVQFRTREGVVTTVVTNGRLWNEGRGDRRVRPGFSEYLRRLFRDPPVTRPSGVGDADSRAVRELETAPPASRLTAVTGPSGMGPARVAGSAHSAGFRKYGSPSGMGPGNFAFPHSSHARSSSPNVVPQRFSACSAVSPSARDLAMTGSHCGFSSTRYATTLASCA
jgi:hypothetical protein